MPPGDFSFCPITFEGVTFPATLMGISILEPVLNIEDEDLGEWLWSFCICRSRTRNAAAERCARCASQTADLIEMNRQRVLDGIHERLATHGFDPESTYRDWLAALRQIAELSAASDGECTWSAPAHSGDPLKSEHDVQPCPEALASGSNKSANVT